MHSSADYRENFAMIDLKDDREDYLVRRELLPDLAGEVVYKTVFTAINRQGVVFLWPIRRPTTASPTGHVRRVRQLRWRWVSGSASRQI